MDLGKDLNREFRFSLKNYLSHSLVVSLEDYLRFSLSYSLGDSLWDTLEDSLRFSLGHSLEVFLKRRQK